MFVLCYTYFDYHIPMKTSKYSNGWRRFISTAFMLSIFLGAGLTAGCSSRQVIQPTESPPNSQGQGIPQNVPSTAQMIAGTIEGSGQAIPNVGEGTKSPACPKLDSQLNQVVASADPLSTAASLNLRLKDGKVQVNLVLASEDASFLKDFGGEPGSQAGREIQAFVPIDQLCAIANLEQVLAIRIPAEAILP